jgi:glycosyltransferase involved in cell wall biosynthesis
MNEKARVNKILEGYSKVCHRPRLKNTGIVFLGVSAQDKDEWQKIASGLGVADRVSFIQNQPRDEFNTLLAHCESVIYSGRAFDLPPAVYQGIAFKKPVLVSMSPEDLKLFDCAPALVSYDNFNSKDIAEKLSLSVSSAKLLEATENVSKKVRKQHSWDELARVIVSEYENLIKKPILVESSV